VSFGDRRGWRCLRLSAPALSRTCAGLRGDCLLFASANRVPPGISSLGKRTEMGLSGDGSAADRLQLRAKRDCLYRGSSFPSVGPLAPGEGQPDHAKRDRNHEGVAAVLVRVEHHQAARVSDDPRG
jgi:hypothetical protein